MSLWRKEASDRLPELQRSITSTLVENPSDLWMQLRCDFDRLCHKEPPPIELLSRIWEYARWSAEHGSDEVKFAVTSYFFEHIKDTRLYRTLLPQFMSRDEYETVCGLRAPARAREKR